MPQITTFLPIFLTQLILVRITHATCTHLPSGRCFVDCTDDVYKVVCESIDGNQLQYDLQTFAGLNTSFELHIWNSPGIGRLGATSFADVHDQIAVLELQNLENLELFPEVAALISLKDLTIGNSPKVRQFPIELIPLSVESLNFHATGIELFYADYTSGKLLPKVRYFRIHQQALTCSDQFFLTFPNLESIEIIECHINLGNLEDAALPFFTAKPLRKLVVTNNTFSSSIANFHLYIFDHIVSSLVVHESSDIEISENAFPIGKKTLQKFNQLSAIKRLSLRGSYFENYQTLENLFKGFNDLEYLDLGRTNIPIYKLGIFNGLPNLQILRLDGNHLQDIEERDFFQGLQANNFSVLDVSNNNLHGHIYGFEKWGKNLMHYDMSGNDVTKSLFTKRAQFFPKLRFMSEARNRRIFTNSSSFTEMKQLDVLDFSCNRFMNITRDFFNRLPPTLRMYNMSFCERKLTDRVIVAEDAFVGFPTIKELYFDRAFLRTNFFTKLQKMPPESAAALLVLHMAYNHIAYLHGNGTHFKPFINLEYLDLEANRMQSTGGAAFSPLKRLRRLNLAKNGIFSISVDDFRGLDSLEDLDISASPIIPDRRLSSASAGVVT